VDGDLLEGMTFKSFDESIIRSIENVQGFSLTAENHAEERTDGTSFEYDREKHTLRLVDSNVADEFWSDIDKVTVDPPKTLDNRAFRSPRTGSEERMHPTDSPSEMLHIVAFVWKKQKSEAVTKD